MERRNHFSRRDAVAMLGLGGLSAGSSVRLEARTGIRGGGTRPDLSRRVHDIVDVHAHAILQSWVEAIRRRETSNPTDMGPLAAIPWSPEMAIETMDAHGIALMVLSNPLGTRGFAGSEATMLARRMNDELAAIVAARPRRFGAFAALPLTDIDASLAELDRALGTLQFDGVCLQTNADGTYLGDPIFEPLFAELNRRRAVAFVHPVAPKFQRSIGLPFSPGLMEFMFDTTRAVASMVFAGMRSRYPDFIYIATHGGGTIPYLAERFAADSMLPNGGYHIAMTADDIRRDLRSFIFDLTSATSSGGLAALTALVPASNIVMGFDYPMRPKEKIAPAILDVEAAAVISDADLPAISRNNALRLLPTVARRLT